MMMKDQSNFSQLLEAFFTERLMTQRQASPNTIASYRDTFCLLLRFAQKKLKKAPSALTIEDLDAPCIGAFLDYLEKDRGNGARSRNARLAAIHSFYNYAALHDPTYSAVIQRVVAMPSKRYDRKPIDFLSQLEVEALLATPDQQTWAGRRDRTLILLTVQTGLRVSELTGLRRQDVILANGPHVRCLGKGRKERCTPLRKEVVVALRRWLRELPNAEDTPLFPNTRGTSLSRDGVEYLLAKHVLSASQQCPSLKNKRISPHVLRHTTAMELLQHGVDLSVIALWLGHESVETTQIYIQADLKMKEKALAKTAPLDVQSGRYRPDDHILAFLKSL